MVKDSAKWSEVVKKKLSKIVQIFQDGPNWSEMVQKAPICYNMVHYVQKKSSKIVENSQK